MIQRSILICYKVKFNFIKWNIPLFLKNFATDSGPFKMECMPKFHPLSLNSVAVS